MNKSEVITLIKRLTGQANLLTIPRAFVQYTGTVDCALFLSQVLYWSDKGKDAWFYKKYEEWEAEISLSEYQVRKAVQTLKTKGILETKLKKANGAPTVHYRLNERAFSESFVQFLKNELRKKSGNLDSAETEESINRDYQSPYTRVSDDFASSPFRGEEFLAALADYEQLRKEKKNQLAPTSRKALYQKLREMGESTATMALRQSVEAGWLRVIEPRERKVSGCEGEHPNVFRSGKMVY
jgi:hypothetical protein